MKFFSNKYLPTGALCLAFFILCTNNPQTARLPDLKIQVLADSAVTLRDTLYLYITAEGGQGEKIDYCLVRENSWNIDTQPTPGFSVVWDFPDTGVQHLIVWATDATGRRSDSDTVTVNVRYFRPEVAFENDTSFFVNEPPVVRCSGHDLDGSIGHYAWTIDGSVPRLTAGSEDSLVWTWETVSVGCHTVCVTAVDRDGLSSAPDSQVVCVTPAKPHPVVSGDTEVSINDTVPFICRTTDTSISVKEVQWSTDPDGRFWATTPGEMIRLQWRLPDTGMQIVRARIIDIRGVTSAPESLTVHVSALPPALTVTGPSLVHGGDSVTFTAQTDDADGTVVRLLWHFGSAWGEWDTVTVQNTLTRGWPVNDSGACIVTVFAVDDDSLVSTAASCTVRILTRYPELVPLHDTTLSSNDTLILQRVLVDTTQTAELFYWDKNGVAGWDDSSASAACTLTYTASPLVRLATGVRNGSGLFFTDTITVHFNRPPSFTSRLLADNDTVWLPADLVPGAFLPELVPFDADGDSLRISIVWGRQTSFDTLPFNAATRLPVDSAGWYQWSVIIDDAWGNHHVETGTTCVGREHTFCFAGHSIVAGFINDANNPSVVGGFRAGVLAGLRDSTGTLERIRPVGPFITGMMSAGSPADDSCFAMSGSFAREMYLLMEQAYQNLTADIWIVMFGVNGSFGGIEVNANGAIIRTIFQRNPKARFYALTSPPFADLALVHYRNYNRLLHDTIAYWADNGYAATVVETDSVLSDGYTIYDSLFSDPVHPNQAGYDVMRDKILEAMWKKQPAPFAVKH